MKYSGKNKKHLFDFYFLSAIGTVERAHKLTKKYL